MRSSSASSRGSPTRSGSPDVDRQDVAFRHSADDLAPFTRDASADVPVRLLGRLAAAGVESGVDPTARRPEWMKVRAHFDDEYLELKRLVRGLDLHTVCESAGCPNIYECWADRTATFMILGDRCTRACGFCLVDTRKPLAVDLDEPRRVADAVVRARARARGDHVCRSRRSCRMVARRCSRQRSMPCAPRAPAPRSSC